jgi:hypothetical protein
MWLSIRENNKEVLLSCDLYYKMSYADISEL